MRERDARETRELYLSRARALRGSSPARPARARGAPARHTPAFGMNTASSHEFEFEYGEF